MEYTHLALFIFIAASYLLGSLPTGLVIARFFGGVDPRTAGSRNIGATNVGRTSGKLAGALTLGGDVLKGVIPTLLAHYYFSTPLFVALVGFSVFIGHIYPVFLDFKGGKGVATACGIFAVISPLALILALAVFFAVSYSTRYVSIGSMTAALSVPIFQGLTGKNQVYVTMSVIMAIFMIIKHADNIRRLGRGEENKMGKPKAS
ncbi:MAG: glycerol-3-phosphate 1-O-acyltransferase PlsY [Thermodesulfobacteriota bacterium]